MNPWRIANCLLPVGVDLTPMDLWIDGERITSPQAGIPPEHTLDAAGLIASPGYIDLHIHGAFGVRADSISSLRTMAEKLPLHGVTAFLPTVEAARPEIMAQQVREIAAYLARPQTGAQVLGIHLEGPFLDNNKAGALNPDDFLPPSIKAYRQICAGHEELIRRVTLHPCEEAAELIRYLVSKGVGVSLGHTDASLEDCDAAFALGASSATHLFNAMAPLHHREPHLPGSVLTSNARVELIADGIHVHPTLLSLVYRIKGETGILLVSDAMAAAGHIDGCYTLGGREVIVQKGIARTPEGALAGSTLLLDGAVRNIVKLGIPLSCALGMASSTPAALLGDISRGSLYPGKLADIVLLDQRLNVVYTICHGHLHSISQEAQ